MASPNKSHIQLTFMSHDHHCPVTWLHGHMDGALDHRVSAPLYTSMHDLVAFHVLCAIYTL